jgi:hypothetical protein
MRQQDHLMQDPLPSREDHVGGWPVADPAGMSCARACFVAPTCGFANQSALKSISEEKTPAAGRAIQSGIPTVGIPESAITGPQGPRPPPQLHPRRLHGRRHLNESAFPWKAEAPGRRPPLPKVVPCSAGSLCSAAHIHAQARDQRGPGSLASEPFSLRAYRRIGAASGSAQRCAWRHADHSLCAAVGGLRGREEARAVRKAGRGVSQLRMVPCLEGGRH